jgi:alpha-ketoglutarate-dependent taurine dioxygenase
LSNLLTFDVDDVENLAPRIVTDIVNGLCSRGCVVVRQKSKIPINHSVALSRLGQHFGWPIPHRLSDERGVHPIRTIAGLPSYANTTNADLLLHTDGSFEERPPQVMLISCEHPAAVGGNTRICFASDIFLKIKAERPEFLHALSLENSFTIRRDNRASAKPVFKQLGNGRMAMTFRYGSDVQISVHPEAQKGYDFIVRLLADPSHFMEFKLHTNEVLVFDNTAVLHGRTEFPPDSGRILHGLWLDGRPADNDLALGFQP